MQTATHTNTIGAETLKVAPMTPPAVYNGMSAASIITQGDTFTRIERMANLMASGSVMVPKHFHGNVADCFAVTMQALQWNMNPFTVASKTHIVSNKLGYEAQLVNAVITSMAPTKDRLHYEWFGPWKNVLGKFEIKTNRDGKEYRQAKWTMADEDGVGVRVFATFKGESEPRVLELLLSQARVRNSTLWADDPRQQLAYLGTKRWASLYCPDVIQGVYSKEELEAYSETEINPEYAAQESAPAQGEAPAQDAPPTEPPTVWPDAAFERQFKKWEEAIQQGRCNHEDCINTMTQKADLSEDQQQRIHAIKAPIDGEATADTEEK